MHQEGAAEPCAPRGLHGLGSYGTWRAGANGCASATAISLHAAARQPHAELYTGLVEVGVGLLPGGGGCKEMLLRLGDAPLDYGVFPIGDIDTTECILRWLA